MKNRKRKFKNRKRRRTDSVGYAPLEPRRLLTGISLQNFNGLATVIIDGSSISDISEVHDLNNGNISVTLNSQQEIFSKADVERIRFFGRNGDDSFTNNSNVDSAAFGHNGQDTLKGGNGNNWIQGGDGNDMIFGGDRNDRLRGRAGDDFIDPGRRHDHVFGGEGNDVVVGSHGNDVIFGEGGNDILRGGDGEDTISGGNGADLIDGGAGNDELSGDVGADEIFGRQGNDTIRGNSGNDTLRGNVGRDQIFGNTGNDVLFGDAGLDSLFGGSGNDSIRGGTGNDNINFGAGSNEFVLFQGDFGDYTITASGQTLEVAGNQAPDGTDTIWQAETLRFIDTDRQAEEFFVDFNTAEVESIRLLNNLRQSMGLNSLTAVVDLSEYAEDWSRNTLPGDFRHSTSQEVSHLFVNGRTLYGENIIFYGDSSLSPVQAAQIFHQTWLESPSHYENMIDNRWTEVGVGLVRLSSGWYGTHSFANG